MKSKLVKFIRNHLELKLDTEDYIANYYVNGEMMQFEFYRAADTIGKEIYIPEYINSLEYEIWK